MSIGTILLIILILVLLGALPAWPYSRGWGYGPSGIAGLVVVVLIVLLLMGRIARRGRAARHAFARRRPDWRRRIRGVRSAVTSRAFMARDHFQHLDEHVSGRLRA